MRQLSTYLREAYCCAVTIMPCSTLDPPLSRPDRYVHDLRAASAQSGCVRRGNMSGVGNAATWRAYCIVYPGASACVSHRSHETQYVYIEYDWRRLAHNPACTDDRRLTVRSVLNASICSGPSKARLTICGAVSLRSPLRRSVNGRNASARNGRLFLSEAYGPSIRCARGAWQSMASLNWISMSR